MGLFQVGQLLLIGAFPVFAFPGQFLFQVGQVFLRLALPFGPALLVGPAVLV